MRNERPLPHRESKESAHGTVGSPRRTGRTGRRLVPQRGDSSGAARRVAGPAAVALPGLGFGDVRLAGIVGGMLGYLSWSTLVIGAFGGFLLGAVAGLAVIAGRRGDRRTALPFGPFMIGAALVAIVAAGPISTAYQRLL